MFTRVGILRVDAEATLMALGLSVTLFAAQVAGAPAGSATSSLKKAEVRSSENDAPEVEALKPAKITPGSDTAILVSGKNFAKGAKVCFSNPGILVIQTDFIKSNKLTAHVQVASDAPLGATSLFVVNPDESEAEVPFEVSQGNPVVTETRRENPSKAAVKTASKTSAATGGQRFEVFSLADAINLLSHTDQDKGTLRVAGGKLSYEENGTEIFSVGMREVQEVAPNTVLDINTGTFHIILSSGKTYNFIAASLDPRDSESIVSKLQKALH